MFFNRKKIAYFFFTTPMQIFQEIGACFIKFYYNGGRLEKLKNKYRKSGGVVEEL